LGLTLLWLRQALQVYGLKIKEHFTLRAHRGALVMTLISGLVAAGLTVSISNSTPSTYRVLSDETNLLGVAKGFYDTKTADNVTMGKFYYGNFQATNREVEKRPLLFPFLTYLVHVVKGYHYENGFLLNLIALFMILFGITRILASRFGWTVALSAALLVTSSPVLIFGATSGCMETLTLLLLLTSGFFLYEFLTQPNPESGALLILQLILLSQARYENLIYVFVFSLVILASRDGFGKWVKPNLLLIALAPIFLLPMVAQRILTSGHFEQPTGVPVFGLQHFLKWAIRFKDLHLSMNDEYPYPTLTLAFSVFLIILFAFRSRFKLRINLQRPIGLAALAIIGSVGAGLLLTLFFYFGDPFHPASSRFFMSYSVVMTLVPVLVHALKPTLLKKEMLVIIALFSFFVYSPIAQSGRFTQSQILIRETAFAYDFLQKKTEGRNFLLITDRPGQYTVANYGAVNFDWANTHRDEIQTEIKRHLFQEVYVFQKISYENERPLPETTLDESFKLIPLTELQTNATEYYRISRVDRGHNP
jgi:hypothetical protein